MMTEPTFAGDERIIRTAVTGDAGFSLPFRVKKVAPLSPLAVVVEIPGRVGYSVRDMSTFGPAKPGGGGVGLGAVLLNLHEQCSESIHFDANAMKHD